MGFTGKIMMFSHSPWIIWCLIGLVAQKYQGHLVYLSMIAWNIGRKLEMQNLCSGRLCFYPHMKCYCTPTHPQALFHTESLYTQICMSISVLLHFRLNYKLTLDIVWPFSTPIFLVLYKQKINIYILPTFSKIVEKLDSNMTLNYLETNHILYSHNYGFH